MDGGCPKRYFTTDFSQKRNFFPHNYHCIFTIIFSIFNFQVKTVACLQTVRLFPSSKILICRTCQSHMIRFDNQNTVFFKQLLRFFSSRFQNQFFSCKKITSCPNFRCSWLQRKPDRLVSLKNSFFQDSFLYTQSIHYFKLISQLHF